jgi:hypothetical protein
MHRKRNISAECECIAKYKWSHFWNFPLQSGVKTPKNQIKSWLH